MSHGASRALHFVPKRMLAIAIVLAFLPLGGPSSDAAHPTWEPPREGDGAALYAMARQGATGVAVGTGGQMLREASGGWTPLPEHTAEDLFGVAFATPNRGLAVGSNGVVLEHGPQWEAEETPADGVLSAHGTSGSGSTERRIIEWRLPRDLLGIGPDSRFGLGVTVSSATDEQTHPPGFEPDRPRSTGPVRWNDVMQGSPTIDGEMDAMWPPAVHAEYVTGPVPFSVHLLRDADALYVMVGARASLAGATLQLHRAHEAEPAVGDNRFHHPFQDDGEATQQRTGSPRWAVHRAPGTLTGSDLHDVAWLDSETPIAVGTDGTAFVRQDRAWSPLATGTTRDLNAVSATDGTALIAGAHGSASAGANDPGAAGHSGAVLLKIDGTTIETLTIPPGTYGLHALDADVCGAGGSGGTLLFCVGGDLTEWTRVAIPDDILVHAIDHDAATGQTWAVGAHDDGTPALFLRTANGWSERFLAHPATGLTALLADAERLVVATLEGDLHTLTKHSPTFVEFPEEPVATEGERMLLTVIGDDQDGDGLKIDIEPREGMPFPHDLTVEPEGPNHWIFDWTPPYRSPPTVSLDVTLSDGDKKVRRGMDIDVIPVNGPPYWEPHPDVTIAHSTPWTTYVQAHDPDNDPLTLTATVPSGAAFTDLGGGQGRIDWTPGPGQIGAHLLDFTATDGALSAALSFTVTVVNNQAPVFDHVFPVAPTICVKGPWWSGRVAFSASAYDPEGTAVTYTWTFHHDGTTQSGSTAGYTYDQTGTYLVSVTATDGDGVQNTRFITVRVDACVHVEVEIDRSCIFLTHGNQGRIRMWDHTGAPTNGTYQVRIDWDTLLGDRATRSFTGTILNGSATFVVPQDEDDLPLNHLGRHTVTGTGSKPGLFGVTRWDTDFDDYLVHPLCGFLEPLP